MTPLQEADDLFIRTEILPQTGDGTEFHTHGDTLFVVEDGSEHSRYRVTGVRVQLLTVNQDDLVTDDEVDLIEEGGSVETETSGATYVRDDPDEIATDRAPLLTERIALSLMLTRKIPLLLLRSMTEGDINDAVWDAVRAQAEAAGKEA